MTYKTIEGCRRLLALFLVIIFVSSFFGRLVQTDFGKIKVEQVTFDARGAEINGELYYPAGTSSADKLPAVVLAHGGGNAYGVFKGIAVELARRGFVVLNESAYGSGLSTMPMYDESGQGVSGVEVEDEFDATENVKGFNVDTAILGILDSVDFVRGLAFVDSTRVGIAGHSMGATRCNAAAMQDCGYFSVNDSMIDALYNTFGVEIAEDELTADADAIAEANLDAEQLFDYYALRAEVEEHFATRIKATIALGDTADIYAGPVTVNLAGYEVQRITKTNMCLMGGELDWCFDTSFNEAAKAGFGSEEDLIMGDWYDVENTTLTGTDRGFIYETGILEDADLSAAIDNRVTRMFYLTPGQTHSEDNFSSDTNSAIVKYFEQTLNYNRGELGAAGANPLDAKDSTWLWETIFNLIAMLAMFGLLLSVGALLVKKPFFEDCVGKVDEEKKLKVGKAGYWIVAAATVALGFGGIMLVNSRSLFFMDPTPMFPITRTASITVYMMMVMAGIAAIAVIALALISKKNGGKTGLAGLNVAMKPRAILKSILLALIIIATAYLSLSVIDYFFGQDYRFWVVIFTVMKSDMWFVALRYAILILPFALISGIGVNVAVREDIPEWRDTLNVVIINSLGIWLCALVETLIIHNTEFCCMFFSGMVGFTCTWPTLFIAPLTVFLARKFYLITKNVWVGASVNALLLCWSVVSACGCNDFYYAQSWISNFLNI